MALLTALFGTLAAYGAALITARSKLPGWCKQVIDAIALVTNTIPGMVLGLAFLFVFSGTSLQNTFPLMILCNIVHYFSTPYLMMKNSLSKMNAGWETTAMLMGDSWPKTVLRVVTPNAVQSHRGVQLLLHQLHGHHQRPHFPGRGPHHGSHHQDQAAAVHEPLHDQVFVLSLLILATNLIAKAIFTWLANKSIPSGERAPFQEEKGNESIMNFKKLLALGLRPWPCPSRRLRRHRRRRRSGDDQQVIIYSNADDEAITAMENALDSNGYEGQYVFQTFGTSELGGKLLVEGTNLEADMVTMSTFYLQSAQDKNTMFLPLDFEVNTLEEVPDYTAPITSQEGAIIVNTEMMASENLPTPTCLKDLADPAYAGQVAVTDVQSSSTAWLLIQAPDLAYGEDGAEETLGRHL